MHPKTPCIIKIYKPGKLLNNLFTQPNSKKINSGRRKFPLKKSVVKPFFITGLNIGRCESIFLKPKPTYRRLGNS